MIRIRDTFDRVDRDGLADRLAADVRLLRRLVLTVLGAVAGYVVGDLVFGPSLTGWGATDAHLRLFEAFRTGLAVGLGIFAWHLAGDTPAATDYDEGHDEDEAQDEEGRGIHRN